MDRPGSPAHIVDPGGRYDVFLRLAARLLHAGVGPASVEWIDSSRDGDTLFAPTLDADGLSAAEMRVARWTAAGLGREGALAACHLTLRRWPLLYSACWRRAVQRRGQFKIDPLDPDTRDLDLMAREVRRDIHKMKAFVRFRRITAAAGEDPDRFVAWHRPDHRILRLASAHFAARFGVMRWTIFTPHESADWDGNSITYGPGVPAAAITARDELDDLWRTYYRAIFNPARIKVDAMLKEMPRRHWVTLPEASIIDELLRTAPERVKHMINRGVDDQGAGPVIPKGDVSLPVLRAAAIGCTGCGLAELATQTVFGEGPCPAEIMVLGEQPGDEEDMAGRPFVGPAGRLLNEALVLAGLDRSAMYITNAVKHFKFEPRGKKRIHQRPGPGEVRACRPWLDREIEVVRPRAILLLGATAGQSLLGPGYRVSANRGQWLAAERIPARLFATIHPSMMLRTPDAQRPQAMRDFILDLQRFAQTWASVPLHAAAHSPDDASRSR